MSAITSQAYSLPPLDLSSPSFVLHLTRLSGSYLLWVGAASNGRLSSMRLGGDWSCGMPSTGAGRPPVGAPIIRGSSSDLSTGMATRLARRFKAQIFLSLDLPPSLTSAGPTMDSLPNAQRVLLNLELGIIRVLEQDKSATTEEAEPGAKEKADEAGGAPTLALEAMRLVGR